MDKLAMKKKILHIGNNGLPVLNLLGWLRNKPTQRVADATRMTHHFFDFVNTRDEVIEGLPEEITSESIAYLKNTSNEYRKMMWSIVTWFLDNEKMNYRKVIALFESA
jgi:hypothetical protein